MQRVSRTASPPAAAPALIGTTATVLVDAPGVGRSHREAPEIDGIITLPPDLPVGAMLDVVITGAEGPDLQAVPASLRAVREVAC